MNDYIVFMHDDAQENISSNSTASWEKYFGMLRASGRFSGGSSIGPGFCLNKFGQSKPITSHLSGYIRLQAESIEDVTELLHGNPCSM